MAESVLKIIKEQMSEAIRAQKCHRCGCLHKTVEALSGTQTGQNKLAPILNEAKSVFAPKEYDCLGCPVCYPAIAANAFSEQYPDSAAELDLCPTDDPEERTGWPPLPGDYVVLRYRAPVAVCTLNSSDLMGKLRDRAPSGLAIVGTMHTENLGIERLLRNVNANPNIRFLILCGRDTRMRIGHLPGQSLASLFANGIDLRSRIIGAQGKRPVLKNVDPEEISVFRHYVELVDITGEEDIQAIAELVTRCADRDPGITSGSLSQQPISPVFVERPEPLVLDPAGYFVLYPEPRRCALVLEHYTNKGVLDAVLEGHSTGVLYQAAIVRGMISRLDHAAYLGQELARAEQSMKAGTLYIQDEAPEPKFSRIGSCGRAEGNCR